MLTIRSTRVLRGPNIWAPVPVIVLEVAIGELEERLGRETPVFIDRLIALLPSLEAHRATVSRPELGFARLLAVRLLNHLLYGSEPGFAFAAELEALSRRHERHSADPFTATIMEAANRRGIPVLELSGSPPLVQLG